MSLSTTVARVQYSPGGSTTIFPFGYMFLDNTHLVVILTTVAGVDITQVLGVDYTVTGALLPAGGTVTMTTAPASGTKLTIYRQTPLTQLVDYVANDNFPAETHERALDKLTMLAQQLADTASRALYYPVTESLSSITVLPAASLRALRLLGFDVSGSPVAVDYTAIPLLASSYTFTVTVPAGTGTSKIVTVQLTGSTTNQLIKAWIVPSTATTPRLARAAILPSENQIPDLETISDLTGLATFTLTHLGATNSWRICVDVSGVIKLSDPITIGV